MHILYIHQYFATPAGQTGTRSYEFARRWVQAGHRVTMLTSAAQLTPRDLGDAPRRLVRRVSIEGIDVLAVDVRYHQTMNQLQRLIAFVRFMILSSWFAMTIRGVDVVYASSTPLSVGVPAIIARWFRRRRFVFEVRDPWPAVPIALGAIRSRWFIALVRALERLIYRNAESVVALSSGMTALVRESAPPSLPIVTIPNCADTEMFRPDVDGSEFRRQWQSGDRVVCVHTGAMGRVNGLDAIVRAGKHFADNPSVQFVLIGEGREKESLERQCESLGLSNVLIRPGVVKEQMPGVLAACDIGLMTVTDVPVLEHNSANKFFDYLSAGKPVLLNYSGWKREVLESAGAGFGCTMGDDEAFVALVEQLAGDEALRRAMGVQARKLADSQFRRDTLAMNALDVLARAAARP